MKFTETAVREWLINYAWLGTPERQALEVDCIMSQDGWKYLDARIEQVKGQASGEETDLDGEATGYALSALYECHGGPHLTTCPHYKAGPIPCRCGYSASDCNDMDGHVFAMMNVNDGSDHGERY